MIVHIVTRHSADCPHLGDEPHKKCNWWKHLRYRENGKLKWKTTEQQTWAGAERFKTNFLLQRDPAHAHLAAQLPKTVTVRDAVNAFLDDKRGQNLRDSSVGKYTLQLAERLATIHNGHADYFFWNGTATHTSIVAGASTLWENYSTRQKCRTLTLTCSGAPSRSSGSRPDSHGLGSRRFWATPA
jgi:hypothetical protein